MVEDARTDDRVERSGRETRDVRRRRRPTAGRTSRVVQEHPDRDVGRNRRAPPLRPRPPTRPRFRRRGRGPTAPASAIGRLRDECIGEPAVHARAARSPTRRHRGRSSAAARARGRSRQMSARSRPARAVSHHASSSSFAECLLPPHLHHRAEQAERELPVPPAPRCRCRGARAPSRKPFDHGLLRFRQAGASSGSGATQRSAHAGPAAGERPIDAGRCRPSGAEAEVRALHVAVHQRRRESRRARARAASDPRATRETARAERAARASEKRRQPSPISPGTGLLVAACRFDVAQLRE